MNSDGESVMNPFKWFFVKIKSLFRKAPRLNDAYVVLWNNQGEQTVVLVTHSEEHAKQVASITDEMFILQASGKQYPTTATI